MKRDTRLISASTLRRAILDAFYEGWLVRPGPNDYFPADQVWDKISRTYGARLDRPLFEGAFNSLLSEEYLQAVELSQGSIGARITAIPIAATIVIWSHQLTGIFPGGHLVGTHAARSYVLQVIAGSALALLATGQGVRYWAIRYNTPGWTERWNRLAT